MTPKEILQEWIDCFNAADAVALANLYAQDAINHQVAYKSLKETDSKE
jgi:ketosteroid isomerase-like protein